MIYRAHVSISLPADANKHRARMRLGAPGLTTTSKKLLLGAPGIATRSDRTLRTGLLTVAILTCSVTEALTRVMVKRSLA